MGVAMGRRRGGRRRLNADADGAYVLVVAVACGRLGDVPAIAGRLAAWRRRLG
jgi:hypothetical protein